MKIIRLRHIVLGLLVIAISITLGVYFIGGLKATTISYDNEEFNSEEFLLDFSYLEQYDRKITFKAGFPASDIDNVANALKTAGYKVEKTDYYGNTAIYLNLNVGYNEEDITNEMYIAQLAIARLFETGDFDMDIYEDNLGEPGVDNLKVVATTDKGKAAFQEIVDKLTALNFFDTYETTIIQVPKEGGEEGEMEDQEIVLPNNTNIDFENHTIVFDYPIKLIETKMSELAIVQKSIEDPDEEVLANIRQDIQRAVGILNDIAESIVLNSVLDNIEYKTSIFEEERIVAQNEKFTMYINEKTTAISIGLNSTGTPKKVGGVQVQDKNGFLVYESFNVLYQLSDYTNDRGELVSGDVFRLRYFGKSGKVSATALGTYSKSVAYMDLIKGTATKHYKINYAGDNKVQVLYEVGEFTNANNFFPKYIERTVFEDVVRGNTWITKVVSSERDSQGHFNLIYRENGVTTNEEAANYIEANGLGKATPAYSVDGTNTFLGYWDLSGLLWTEADYEDGKVTIDKVGKPKLVVGVNCNTKDSPVRVNPFLTAANIKSIMDGNYELIYNITTNETNKNYIHYTENSSKTYENKATSESRRNELYMFLYDISPTNYMRTSTSVIDKYDDSKIVYYEGRPVVQGGVPLRDAEGNYVYDQLGNPVRAQFSEPFLAAEGEERRNIVEEQNRIYQQSAASASAVFQVGVQYELTLNGLKFDVLHDSIKEGASGEDGYPHEFRISSIEILPFFNKNFDHNSEGEIIIPDGSGAVIGFNSDKQDQFVAGYQPKKIYGFDKSQILRTAPADVQTIMLPMYAYLDKTENVGVIGIIESAPSHHSIVADFMRTRTAGSSNYVNYEVSMRDSEFVNVGRSWYVSSYQKWSKSLIPTDLSYYFQFIVPETIEDGEVKSNANFNYVEVAKQYRSYLINKYDLQEIDQTKTNVVNLNFLGAFEKDTMTAGFVYQKTHSLTTFEEAQEIIEILKEKGVENFSVSYTSWTKDEMEPKARKDIKISNVLGGKKGFKKLSEFLTENNINFYPEVNVSTNQGYDYPFGMRKYNAKSVSNTETVYYPYVVPTGRFDRSLAPIYHISPRFYQSYFNKYLANYEKLNTSGIYLSDLGNLKVSSYDNKKEIFTVVGQDYQIATLDIAKESGKKVMLKNPFDYALQYANIIVDAPVTTTLYPAVEHSIPLYQLALSGLVDYTTTTVNYNNQQSYRWYLLKALETGSNLNFVISYADTNTLLTTDYTEYFNTYFLNWENKIVEMNQRINEAGIHQGRLVDHKYITDNVVQSTYANDFGVVCRVIINYANSQYLDSINGISIAANDYVILEGE